MNVKWDIQLTSLQRTNPVLYYEKNAFDLNYNFNAEKFNEVLEGNKHQLKTWGGAESTSKPHWIGVKKATPLHTDPRYPRYTWHYILKVDNFGLRGVDKVDTKLENNMLILLDTHSPHQLFSYSKEALYYFACSIDSKKIMGKSRAKEKLHQYVLNNDILNSVKRISK
jgi:hypothetical protein